MFRLISLQAKHPPQAVACGSSLDPPWRCCTLGKTGNMRLKLFVSTRELPGNKKRLGISRKTSELVFREIPGLFPVRLRTGGPAKPACPGAACFRSHCYCGALLDKKVMPHPQWMGSGEDHPPRQGLGQRPGILSAAAHSLGNKSYTIRNRRGPGRIILPGGVWGSAPAFFLLLRHTAWEISLIPSATDGVRGGSSSPAGPGAAPGVSLIVLQIVHNSCIFRQKRVQ